MATVKTTPTKLHKGATPVASPKTIYNPPFDKRILSMPMLGVARTAANDSGTGSVSTVKFQRGRIVRDDLSYGVNFLYNPSVITVSHSADTDAGILPSTVLDPNNIGVFNVALQSSLSFETLFDRTFELWDRSLTKTMAGKYGVSVDVAAFYQLCGMNFNSNTDLLAAAQGAKVATSGAPNDMIASPMQKYPCRVMFGGAYALSYSAWITGLEVEWLHWTQGMVPSRARVAVTMQLLPKQILATGNAVYPTITQIDAARASR